METSNKLGRSLTILLLITLSLLAIPFIAMQFTSEVNWTAGDFIGMGILIFIIGLGYVLISRTSGNIFYRMATALMIGTTFLMIWINLAVGLIGAGPHTGNVMYAGITAVLLVGIVLSRFTAAGLARGMYATVLALVLHTLIAFSLDMQDLPGSSTIEILGINGFFTLLYLLAGLLYRNAKLSASK
jgi:hypothetical protein